MHQNTLLHQSVHETVMNSPSNFALDDWKCQSSWSSHVAAVWLGSYRSTLLPTQPGPAQWPSINVALCKRCTTLAWH